MFAKNLTGCFSHCCVEGGDHWIYVCIFVAHDSKRCIIAWKVSNMLGSFSFSRSNLSLVCFGLLIFLRRRRKVIISKSWSLPMSAPGKLHVWQCSLLIRSASSLNWLLHLWWNTKVLTGWRAPWCCWKPACQPWWSSTESAILSDTQMGHTVTLTWVQSESVFLRDILVDHTFTQIWSNSEQAFNVRVHMREWSRDVVVVCSTWLQSGSDHCHH